MSTPTKARVAVLICVLFMVWPAVHRVVVAVYGTNAWRLGGFAMYATPPARTRVSIVEKRGSQKTILLDSALPATLVQQRRLYTVRRGVLGSLLPPDPLARAYFEARPEVDYIEVVITREMLSASTARIERREKIYVYHRSRLSHRGERRGTADQPAAGDGRGDRVSLGPVQNRYVAPMLTDDVSES